MEAPARPSFPAAIAAIAACVLLGAIALVAREPVPLLSLVNLGFHELGHLLTYPFPDVVTAVMGSATQLLVPLGLAAYFAWRRRDRIGAGVCLAWAAVNAQEWSVYRADAPFEELELIGGEHDWAFALDRLGWMEAADELAAGLYLLGWALLLAGLTLCALSLRPARDPLRAPIPGVVVKPISWEDPPP
jgi:hypothetical protein